MLHSNQIVKQDLCFLIVHIQFQNALRLWDCCSQTSQSLDGEGHRSTRSCHLELHSSSQRHEVSTTVTHGRDVHNQAV